MASPTIRSVEALRDIIKAPPGTVTAKVMSGPLRASPSEFLAAARLGVVTLTGRGTESRIFAVGGPAGFVSQHSPSGDLVMALPTEFDAEESSAQVAGLLLMVPGIKYTLRVNGPAVVNTNDNTLTVTPEQHYAHCAKAFIRSGLWNARTTEATETASPSDQPHDHLDDAATAFIASSPFAAIGTSLVGSDADVSPRGDPAGFARVTGPNEVFLPERPGNRIADSLQNIIANPAASLLFVVPGDSRVLEVNGDAAVSTDDDLCAATEVNGKRPKLGVLVTVRSAHLRREPALEASGAWDATTHAVEADLPTIGALVADPEGRRSITKRALTGITDRAVGFDYKRNLY